MVDRVGVREKNVAASTCRRTLKLMAGPVFSNPSGRQFLTADQPQAVSLSLTKTEPDSDLGGPVGRSIIKENNFANRRFLVKKRLEAVTNPDLLVAGGNQHRNVLQF
jgi:hypothetical protein